MSWYIILTEMIWPFPSVHRYKNIVLYIINTRRVFVVVVVACKQKDFVNKKSFHLSASVIHIVSRTNREEIV